MFNALKNSTYILWFSFLPGVVSIAICTSQIAPTQANKDTGKTSIARFPLDGVEYFRDVEFIVHPVRSRLILMFPFPKLQRNEVCSDHAAGRVAVFQKDVLQYVQTMGFASEKVVVC